MRRTVLLCLAVVAGAFVLGIPAVAIAGGGCHGSMTQADATDRDKTTIHMVNACFDASVLRVDPGTAVTFSHEDAGLVHNVGGTEWGFYGEMREGDEFTATFDDVGVYPFSCSYHPGMNGAIVVGDALGAGTGWTVLNDLPVDSPPEKSTAVNPVATSSSIDGLWIALAGIGGVAVGAAAGFSARASRRRSEQRAVTSG
jgi:plastocyanin